MFSWALLPWSGGSMKWGNLPKLGLLSSTCYKNSYRWRGFSSDRRWRHLQGGSRPVIFDDIYESGFLPTGLPYRVWTSMAPLFGQMEGGDSLLCNVSVGIVWVTFLWLSRTDVKFKVIQVPMDSLKTTILFLNFYRLYLSHMNLHLARISVVIGISFFFFTTPATSEVIRIGSPCIHGPNPKWNIKKER